MVKIFTPDSAVSNQKVSDTKEERARDTQRFKERKAEQERIKSERFSKIKAGRKDKPGGGGRGINIEIKGE